MTGDALTDMFPQLAATLLPILSWLLGAGLLAGATMWWWQRRRAPHWPLPRRSQPDSEVEPRARRVLRIGLGLLWMIDALLQAQPAMPAGFVAHTLTPGISSSPGWLVDLVHPFAQAWTHHPVAADSVTVFLQLGLGLLMLVGGRGLVARATLWASLLWCSAIWVGGEFFGGLLASGASWLSGAPGAVVVYALATALLLVPWDRWNRGDAPKLARRAAAVWILVGATLQALPWEGSWSSHGLSAPFEVGAHTGQPSLLLAPITFGAHLAASHPVAVNAAIVTLLVTIGVGLFFSSSSGFVAAGITLCLATWWLAQDFGVLGGLATDPNTALPLALVLVAGWPRPPFHAQEPAERDEYPAPLMRLGPQVRVGLTTMGVGAVLVVPLLLLGTLLGPPDASAVVADSSGGVIAIPHRAAPDFTLTDQTGTMVSISKLRGTLTLVTFLDPVCSDDCPIIANQIAAAVRALGPLARRVQVVAIDTNPLFHRVEDVQAFTGSHGLGDLPNWHFLAGPATQLDDALAGYGIVVQVPAVGMISHGEGIYFISPAGTTLDYLGDGANPQLSQGYTSLIEQEIRRLLA